jgi:ABC-type sugar transport system substrate-binding protein
VKRIWVGLLVLAVAAALLVAACQGTAEETTTTMAAEPATGQIDPITSGKIAVCLPALDNPLMLEIKSTFEDNFSDKYEVEVASADGNANTQAQQVQNYTSMGVKFMCVMAVEATSLLPYLEAARDAGVFVMVIGGEPGVSGRDLVMKMDQYLAGEYCALMAKDWVDATYPGAADGSVETAVFVSSLTTESVQRTNGLLMISEPYLKDWEGAYIDAEGNLISDKDGNFLSGKSEADRVANPAYCPAVNIVQTPTAEMFQSGQTAMQNVLTTNPDVKLVLAYASDGGSGASQAIRDEIAKGAGSVIKDPTKVAVFGVGVIGPERDAIKAASIGEGFLRGAVSFGGADLPGKTSALVKKVLNGEEFTRVIWDELAMVTAVSGELVITPMPASGVLTTTPLPVTEVPVASTTTVAGGLAVGIHFQDQGNNVVKVIDVPALGMEIPIHTQGGMACKVEAFDASGASLGLLETADGMVDYSAIADSAVKIVVTNPHGLVAEYTLP